MYEVDGPVVPPEGERVEGSQGNPVQGIWIVAAVGVNGILGEDI
jgi:hypothetical protein